MMRYNEIEESCSFPLMVMESSEYSPNQCVFRNKDEYKAENVFFVPEKARWSYMQSKAKLPEIGKEVDQSMDAIEKDNPTLKDVLPKVYARGNLDPTNLGGLIDLVGNIALGDAKTRSADVLGHVFEYFLGEFALAAGQDEPGDPGHRQFPSEVEQRMLLFK